MNWQNIETLNQLEQIRQEPLALIFKHSTRCSISSAALDRLERKWSEEEMQALRPYFLDLLSHRDISNKIAEIFGIEHQSPQVLVLENGKCIYHNSHYGIDYDAIKSILESR
ncbi:MAG: bacillithiol system redox-active protein YtxJ [Raineya sp.]